MDGSKIALPDSEEVCAEFGTIAYAGGKSSEIAGERPYALASVLYDVLNRVALDAVLGRADAYEVDLAVAQLAHTRPGDLLLLDRNYPSYRMLAEFVRRRREFAARCSAASFAQAALDAKAVRHPQTVNRAVSFNAIKNEALALLLGGLATGPLLEKLTALFLTNPCLERKGRNPPRKKSSARALLDFHRRQKKHCF